MLFSGEFGARSLSCEPLWVEGQPAGKELIRQSRRPVREDEWHYVLEMAERQAT